MKIIQILTNQMFEELCDADKYIDGAITYKLQYPKLAELYGSLASVELGHAEELHKQAVNLITEFSSNPANEIPEFMKEIWDEEHIKVMNRMAEIKHKIELAKK